jgi:ribosomal protein L21E
MQRYLKGERVRVDIPNQSDPDFDHYHGRSGRVQQVLEDDAGIETEDHRDSLLYRIKFENGEIADFRWRDLRPR